MNRYFSSYTVQIIYITLAYPVPTAFLPASFEGGSIYILKENAEALVAATREIGLEVSADKTKYMVMSRDQNAGRIHSVRSDIVPSRGWKSLNIWEQL